MGGGVVTPPFLNRAFSGGLMKASGVMYIKLKDEFDQSAVATVWVFSLFTTFVHMFGNVGNLFYLSHPRDNICITVCKRM